MGRTASPWFNRAKRGWYVEVDGRQIPLVRPCENNGQTKAEAMRVFGGILAERGQAIKSGIALFALCDLFADHVERERSPLTREWYERHLSSFVKHVGPKTGASTILPKHVTEWLNAHPWGATTRHGAITAVKRLYRWAKREGHLEVNPLVDMEKPTPKRREAILSADQVEAILSETPDQQFRDLLVALRETGARPGELCGLTVDRVSLGGGTWTVVNKTRHSTGNQTRIVYLNDSMLAMSGRLLEGNREGNVFLNLRGNPWTRHAIACRFGELKVRLERRGIVLGKEGVAYSLRHLYITDALERGIPPATVAELVGHQDLNMIMRIYNKLKHRTDHLREAANNARPESPT